jgi:iduronate 2-sulfatase
LLAVGFVKPHLPFVAPRRYWDLYDPAGLPMPVIRSAPEGAPSYAATNGGELRNYSDMTGKGPIDDPTTRHLIHGYYAATSYVDAQIGKVIDALDRLDMMDRTIVVLWGDHGWHLGDHGMWCKHTNYEQAARIPVIVVAPDGDRGRSSGAMIETVDIYATLCELAGLPLPASIDGVSFAGVVRNDARPPREYVTHVYPRGGRLGRAIRTDRFRMVEWKVPGQPADAADIELYDYQRDPQETRNVASERPQVVAELRSLLSAQGEAKRPWKPPAGPGRSGGSRR